MSSRLHSLPIHAILTVHTVTYKTYNTCSTYNTYNTMQAARTMRTVHTMHTVLTILEQRNTYLAGEEHANIQYTSHTQYMEQGTGHNWSTRYKRMVYLSVGEIRYGALESQRSFELDAVGKISHCSILRVYDVGMK